MCAACSGWLSGPKLFKLPETSVQVCHSTCLVCVGATPRMREATRSLTGAAPDPGKARR